MRIGIFTEGGGDVGLGHVSRCTAFYDVLDSKQIETQLMVMSDVSITSIIEDRKARVFPAATPIEAMIDQLTNFDAIILDRITITQTEIDLLLQQPFKLLVIDDYNRYQYKDTIIVDWTVGVENTELHAHNRNDNILLLGVEYAALRRPFWVVSQRDPNAGCILITMGGADVRDLSPSITQAVRNHYATNLIRLVIGPAFQKKNVESLRKIKNISIIEHPDAERMLDAMLDADLVITAGGQTLYELNAVQRSAIAIEVADNQREDIAAWNAAGLVQDWLVWDDTELCEKLLISTDKYFGRIHETGPPQKEPINNNGVEKVIDILLRQI